MDDVTEQNQPGFDPNARLSVWRERSENAINGATDVYPVCLSN